MNRTRHLNWLAIIVAIWSWWVPRAIAGTVWVPTSARFHPGDDPAWALPEFDDSAWGTETEAFSGEFGWCRFSFTVPAEWSDDALAVSVGFVGSISAIYVNGRRIGGEGLFGGKYTDSAGKLVIEPLWAPPPRTVHSAVIPPGLLKFGEERNVLAVRVFRVTGRGGLLGGPLGVSPAREVQREKNHAELQREAMRIIVFSVCLAWACLLFMLGKFGKESAAEFRGAIPPLLLAVWHSGFQTTTFQSSPLNGIPAHFINYLLLIATPPAFFLFYRKMFGSGGRWLDRLVIAGAVGNFLAGACAIFVHFSWAWGGFLLNQTTAGVAAFVVGWRAWKLNVRDSGWFLVAWVVLCVAYTFDALLLWLPWMPVGRMWWTPSDIAVALFVFISSLLLLRRYVAARRDGELLRGRLLSAQEAERRRIGRELHDGVAQELEALRLRLQMHCEKPDDGQLQSCIEGLRSSLREIRTLAADLQPECLRHANVADAIKHMAVNLPISVVADELPPLPEPVRENVYRIAQEATRNALKHGNATKIEIALRAEAGRLVLIVRDDGAGFDVDAASGRLGIGFMKDRATLCGGTLKIDSRPGSGTTLTVTIPIL